MARPKKPDPLTAKLWVRMTEAEKAELVELAASTECGGVSDYVRRRALGHRITSRVDLNAINELRRLGGLVKHALTQDATNADDYRRLLATITTTVKRLGRPEA